MATPLLVRLTEEQYLEQERANEFRSEYIDGRMLAMSGGWFRHSALASSLIGIFNARLADLDCLAMTSDVKVLAPISRAYLYPDVSVVCGDAQAHGSGCDILLNPTVIVEVLSPSTQSYDLGPKFDLYKEVASLREYLVVYSHAVKVEAFSRLSFEAPWSRKEAVGMDSQLLIPAISLDLSLLELYSRALRYPA